MGKTVPSPKMYQRQVAGGLVSYTRVYTGVDGRANRTDFNFLKTNDSSVGIAFTRFCGMHATCTHFGHNCPQWQAHINLRKSARAERARRTEESSQVRSDRAAASYASRARAAQASSSKDV